MNSKEKAQFRKSKEWLEFREYMKAKFNNKDAITGENLRKGWNLHHMDLNSDNYTNLDENYFIPLNKGTHEKLHAMYIFCRKEDRVIKLFEYINEMENINAYLQREQN